VNSPVADGRPLVLIVDDEPRFRALYGESLSALGVEVATAADSEEALALIRERRPAMVISDVRMPGASGLELLQQVRRQSPDVPFLLVTAYADVRDAVRALKMGAVDYLQKPVDLDELLAAVEDTLQLQASHDRLPGPPASALAGIVAEAPAMRALLADAHRVAASDATVLLQGESGTGKEVVASFIHRNSPRRDRSLVALNCASIPAPLLGSELFGHQKGAFTGAIGARQGRFREAEGGTLFLDEIGDMPIELQPALLRAIETGRIVPVGCDREEPVDFRLIAATHRRLPDLVQEGKFREDLYYRLNVITFEIPPLRERPEDIEPLARHFLACAGNVGKRFSPAALRALQCYRWPGNVRELANAVERASILSDADVILPERLPPAVLAGGQTATLLESKAVRPLNVTEQDEIQRALQQTGGNRTRAATLLGISRRALIYKLKRYGNHAAGSA
jgi:two-component system, NtrC family, response regulator HydG